MTTIYVDGDACPVKAEVFRAGAKRGLAVVVVANAHMRKPPGVEVVIVSSGMDAADDWIASHCAARDVVVTADIELASRVLKAGAAAIDPRGKEFTENNIGSAVATRDLMKDLRAMSGRELGPRPMADRDRRAFMKAFSALLERLRLAGR
jgi:uncharacterized protein YaiI (UPF0178 family)